MDQTLDQDRIIKINIEEEMKSSYIDYSMSVIVARALPDVRDGFKLQGVCTKDGTLVKICFRPGSEHDSKAFDDSTKGLKGTFVTDAGYLLKESELKEMFESGRRPCTATRKNMNRLMSEEQFQLLNSRNIIENVWSVLKLNYNLIYHRARSITGMFRHFFYSISAFLFHKAHEIRKEFSSKLCVLEKLEF